MDEKYKEYLETENNIWENKYIKMLFMRMKNYSFFSGIIANFSYKNKFREYIFENYGINSVEKLKFNDITKIIRDLESKIKVSDKYIKIIKKKFSIEEVRNILNNVDMDFEDLRINDLKKLYRYNPEISFGLMINDKNNIPKCKNKIIEYSENYEYGVQESKCCESGKMFYVKFYDMLVLDYDNIEYDKLMSYLIPFKEKYLFRIYKTYRGFHVFLISDIMRYNDKFSLDLALSLNSDKMYIIYSKYNGYNVRLTPKIGYNEKITHRFVTDYGSGIINESIKPLLILFKKLNKEQYNKNIENDVFYGSFVNLVNSSIDSLGYYNDYGFVKYLIKNEKTNEKITVSFVKDISKYFIRYVSKSQRLLYTNKNLYVAVDTCTNLHYICYKNVLMVDLDNKKKINDKIFYENILLSLKKKNDSFRIYKSTNGYHVFVTNRYFEYNSDETIQYLIDLGCDINYIICVYLRGFCVRMNKKTVFDKMYKHIIDINESNNDESIISLINLHCHYFERIVY